MLEKLRTKPANQSDIQFFAVIGEAVVSIQYLEDALSHCIALKGNYMAPRKQADEHVAKYRSKTLRLIIECADKENVFPEFLQIALQEFLEERNWLIHRCMQEIGDDIVIPESRMELMYKIKSICEKAQILTQTIEANMISFAESKGKDMSKVRDAIEQYYKGS